VATRPIVMHTNPRLRKKSIKVKQFDRALQTLIDDMIETMRGAEGVGLAAPQVGVLLRVIVCEYADEETEELHQTILVNPEFLAKECEWMAEEGCLSLPGYVGTVPRAVWVSVKGKDRNGKDVRIKTDGALAHILQHEIDHLDGVLYIDYLKSMDELREVEPNRKRRRRPRSADDTEGPDTNDAATAAADSSSAAEGAQAGPDAGSAAPPHRSEERSSARRRYRGSLICGSVCPPCE